MGVNISIGAVYAIAVVQLSIRSSLMSIGDNCFFTEMYCEQEQKNTWERKLVEVLSDQTAVSSIDDVTLKLNGSAFSIELSRI